MQLADHQSLVGCWRLTKADRELEMNDPVEMEFKANGELLYCIESGDKWQVMRLTYRIDGDSLVTNQPSHPSEERTSFSLDPNGSLVLDYGSAQAHFERGPKSCPVV
jgi:6-phosphogluconolactonase (cycloisomerase 2 family)